MAKHIPIADARWIGNRLGQSPPSRSVTASAPPASRPNEVEGYARIVMQRIEALKKLIL